MSSKTKLMHRSLSFPKDFTYQELVSLLESLEYVVSNCGQTSGSAARFYNAKLGSVIRVHKPPPGNVMKEYTLKTVCDELKEAGLL